jgi:histidinol-phosphate aminotransferase
MHRNVRVESYEKGLVDLDLENLSKYPDIANIENSIAKFDGVDRENILITSGIDGGLKTIFEMTTQKGSKAIYLTPTYAMYKVYADAYEVEMIPVQTKEETLNIELDEIMSKINETIDIVFIPNPHIPIENTFHLENIEKIIKKAEKLEVLVVIDEAYYMFGSETATPLINKYNNIIVARTFSKGFGLPAIRLGYLIANKNLISYLGSRRFAHETNSLSAEIGSWAIENIDKFETYNLEVVKAREWLKVEFEKLGVKTHGEKTNTVLLNLETEERAKKFGELLKNEDFVVKTNNPEPFKKYILVTVGKLETMKLFFASAKNSLEKL